MENISTSSVKSTPRDVFLYLLVTGTLYASAIALISLLFAYIDVLLPDTLGYCYTCSLDQIRWTSSALLVVFPVFLFLFRKLSKEILANPERREIKVRKWLVYLTLFIASVTIIVDLITLIYNFYSGELTSRFGLKVLVVLAVAASIFGYYIWEIRRKVFDSTKPKMIAWLVAVAVLVSIVGGFFIVGSPATQRERRFDEQRITDLRNIQSTIVYNYYASKGKLPASLSDLRNDITGFIPPVDPQTGKDYDYRVNDALTFELCADFKTDSKDSQGYPKYSVPALEGGPFLRGQSNWQHRVGPVCFTRTIDPDFFKPNSPLKPF